MSRPTALFGAPFFIAVTFSLLMSISLITALVFFTPGRPRPDSDPVSEKAEQESQEQERQRAERERADWERDRQIQEMKALLAKAEAALAEAAKASSKPALSEREEARPPVPDAEKPPVPAEAAHRAEFARHMQAGRTALEAGRFADAAREFALAQQVMPEDLEAQHGQKQAETKLAALEDKAKRRAAFEDLLERGRKALTDRRFKEAVALLQPACRLIPDDREGQRLLREAHDELKKARSINNRLVQQIQEAARVGRLDEAQQLAEQAFRNWPEDVQAEQALQQTKRRLEQVQSNQAAYVRLVQQGTLAMAGNRFGEAVAAYSEALRLTPTDPDILRNLRTARAALERDLRVRGEYERLYRAGNAAYLRGAYRESIGYFAEALTLIPDDLAASEALRKVRYTKALVEAQQALRLGRHAEAAARFEAALRERPGDLTAQLGLRQARMAR